MNDVKENAQFKSVYCFYSSQGKVDALMKKIALWIMACSMIVFMAACGGDSGQTTDKNDSGISPAIESASEQEGVGGISVDEGVLNVKVTIPASFFSDMSDEDIKAAANDNGYSDCVINDNGSVTYTMSKSKHKEMLEQYKENMDQTISDMLEGDNAVESFISIDCNDDYSEVNIKVNPDKYSLWDSFYAMSFYITGAYYQSFSGVAADDIDVIVNFINNDTQEILNTASYKEFIANSSSETEDGDDSVQDEVSADALELGVQETITLNDIGEFFVDFVDLTNDVMPPKPGKWYSHYEADAGKVYVDLCIAYKNLETSNVSADDIISGQLLYAGQYQYSGFSIIEEDSRSDFTYSNITSISPLSQEYIHYLFEVPNSIMNSDGKLEIFFSIGGNKYSFLARDGVEGNVESPNPTSISKASGEVKTGESIAIIKDCEFWVDYSNITSDVIPPSPGKWYSHYEADDGKVYVDFCIGFKNWKSVKVNADKVITAKLTYAGKYEYTGFSMIEEDSRGDFTYSNISSISPLSTEYLHYLFEIPSEVQNSSESIVIDFTISGNTYRFSVR